MSDSRQAEVSPGLRISQYWDTDVAPDYMDTLFASFRDRNPDFEHRVFSEVETERFIAEHFGSRELAAFKTCAVPSMQSDYFRYCAVLALGGVYADADYRCVSSLRPLVDGLDTGEIYLSPTPLYLGEREATRVWSGFFAFREPGHRLLRLALDIATANVEARIPERIWPAGKNVVESIWLTVGPGVLSLMRFIREWGSFDAFGEAVADTPAGPFADLYCEAIGDYDRITEAFDGVRVASHEEMSRFVTPDQTLPYKQTDVHWHNVETAIFR